MIKVKAVGLNTVTKILKNAEKQARYASAYTFTGAAFEARKAVQANLPKWLTLRNKFLQNSIWVERANKENLEARVGFHKRANWAVLLEEGGTRKARGGKIAIPQGVRADPTRKIPKRLRPSALRGRTDVFRKTINGIDGIWQLQKNRTLKLLYNLDPQTEYESGKIHFRKTAANIAIRHIARNMEKNYQRALRTAK